MYMMHSLSPDQVYHALRQRQRLGSSMKRHNNQDPRSFLSCYSFGRKLRKARVIFVGQRIDESWPWFSQQTKITRIYKATRSLRDESLRRQVCGVCDIGSSKRFCRRAVMTLTFL